VRCEGRFYRGVTEKFSRERRSCSAKNKRCRFKSTGIAEENLRERLTAVLPRPPRMKQTRYLIHPLLHVVAASPV
jgi:hypothetical protein